MGVSASVTTAFMNQRNQLVESSQLSKSTTDDFNK